MESGGTIYKSTVKRGVIQDVEPDYATVMTSDLNVMCKNLPRAALEVPTVTSILAIASLENISALTINVSTYKPGNFIPIALFLSHPILDVINQSKKN